MNDYYFATSQSQDNEFNDIIQLLMQGYYRN